MMSADIRPLDAGDSIEELTELVHRAYRPLAEAGFRYYATHQTADETRERIRTGRCYVALVEGRITGTVTCYYPIQVRDRMPGWYRRRRVAAFGQFAVEPTLQRRGLGGRLLTWVEEAARRDGALELAMDTAEGATHLIAWYAKRGFRRVDVADWRPTTNYTSIVMSKTLRPAPPP